ncbi:MAG: sugar phosphate isomerase/epimerase [Clostridia bacterium]|nr:sugar phosphate isomerase/epimerase [Clostridia bacterium]
MKLAFSTLGCPGWSWEEIYATAKDLGLHGIEIRGIESEIYAPHTKPFKPENINKTLENLKKLQLEIPMLTSAAYLFDEENQEAALNEAKAYVDLASKIGAPYIRVLGDKDGAPGQKVNIELVKKLYTEICDYAKDKGVSPLIETNGVFADSKVMAAFIKDVNCPNAGILWDIHHPFRYFGETPETTLKYLDGHIKYLHIKDSVMKDGQVAYRMLGYGDVPVLDCLKQLKKNGYEGYVSLEWLKRWCPDLQEPGVVFSHYISYMSYLLRQI